MFENEGFTDWMLGEGYSRKTTLCYRRARHSHLLRGVGVKRGHQVASLDRLESGHWVIWCECLRSIHGTDPIEAHRLHQDHVVEEFLAEQSGVERVAS